MDNQGVFTPAQEARIREIFQEEASGAGQNTKSAAGATATLSEYMNEQRKTIKETQKAFAVEKETGSH